MKGKIILVLILIIAFTASCSRKEDEQPDDAKIILTSILPIKLITAEIVGGLHKVECIIDKPVDPHSFELNPGDAARIESSFVFIINGADMEFWAEDFITDRKKNDKPVIDSSNLIPAENLIFSHVLCQTTPAPDHHGQQGDGPNPHFWLDPLTAVYQAREIAHGLSIYDSDNANHYKSTFIAFQNRMKELDANIRENLNTLKNRSYIEYHSASIYFAQRYDLLLYDVLFKDHDSPPSPGRIKRLTDDLKLGKYYGIFGEIQSQNRELYTIADEVNRKVVLLDPMGFSIEAGTYDDLILHNLRQFKKGLK